MAKFEGQEYKIVIRGDVPSKANSYRVIVVKGHASLGKTSNLKAFEKSFFLQCQHRGINIASFFTIDIDVYYANNRKDLDGCFKILLDCLQQCKVIKNDRECIEIHARKLLDSVNPRVEMTIRTVAGIEVHKSNEPSLFDKV